MGIPEWAGKGEVQKGVYSYGEKHIALYLTVWTSPHVAAPLSAVGDFWGFLLYHDSSVQPSMIYTFKACFPSFWSCCGLSSGFYDALWHTHGDYKGTQEALQVLTFLSDFTSWFSLSICLCYCFLFTYTSEVLVLGGHFTGLDGNSASAHEGVTAARLKTFFS